MRRTFRDIQVQLLINRPVVWISSIYWILALCVLIIVLQTIIGWSVKVATSLTGFYASAIFFLIVLLFLWVSFQYRNYDKIFTIRQTFRIYLYNILAYIFICISSLVLVVSMTIRFKMMTTPQTFSKELLSVRVAHLSADDIDFVKASPQLFTSIGTNSDTNIASNVDLETEYRPRQRLERNPFIKNNISDRYNALIAIQKMPDFAYLDSVMQARQAHSSNILEIDYGIDEDPVFYKYLKPINNTALDSLRKESERVIRKYGLSVFTGSFEEPTQIWDYYNTLVSEVRAIELNNEVPITHILTTVIILMLLCSVTFNFILTKNTLCLFTPFVYVGILTLLFAFFHALTRPFDLADEREFVALIIGNIVLSAFVMLAIQLRKRFGSSMFFFFQQMQNMAALGFFIFIFVYAANTEMATPLRVTLVTLSIAGFLATHYYFIRRMHRNLVQER